MNNILPILRSTAFRTAAAVASAFTSGVVLLFAFIYWQTTVSETARITNIIVSQSELIRGAPPEQILWMVQTHVAADLHRVTFAALFDRQGEPIAGNLQHMPPDLLPDGKPHWVEALAVDDGRTEPERVIAVARRLGDGRLLVIGRNIEELANLRRLVTRALALGVIPAVLLALGVGAWMGQRTGWRVRSWQRILTHVREGQLGVRLPTRENGDDVDQLAASVNHMLDELVRLLGELHNVGNTIAHDLRTPLARARAQLERTRRGTHSREDLERAIEKAMAGLDQSISITTSLLRLAEIEGSRRRDAFGPVDLVDIAREVAEFYEPAAEQKGITIHLDLLHCPPLFGDHDLLFEAVANLVDNAVKFTPPGGTVRLLTEATPAGPQLRVADNGPGIPASVRAKVFKRFFRFDTGANVPGIGLGLCLVAAIAKLHGYALAVEDARPGCVVVLTCRPSGAPSVPEPARDEYAGAMH